MTQGTAHTRPSSMAVATVASKCSPRSAAGQRSVRSSSHPARANSAVQMTSTINTSKPAARPSRLIT